MVTKYVIFQALVCFKSTVLAGIGKNRNNTHPWWILETLKKQTFLGPN